MVCGPAFHTILSWHGSVRERLFLPLVLWGPACDRALVVFNYKFTTVTSFFFGERLRYGLAASSEKYLPSCFCRRT
ncbi:unnamed protein product [Lathyrus oleraceus]